MSFALAPYLPGLYELLSVAGVLAAALLMAGLGTAAAGRDALGEVRFVTGWGLLCLVLTFWGVATPVSLRIPAAVLGALGLVLLAWRVRRAWRLSQAATATLWRFALLSLPLWLVMVPARPSQVDTWLNLLPNAAYLYDYGMFPADLRPASYSFLPGAPYNTQFAAFAASLIAGRFADNALALFNILLQLAAAALIARLLAGERAGRGAPLPWWACAAGFLLAIALNPGFVPRVFFASYGEAPLAVTVLFALFLGTRLVEDAISGERTGRTVAALACALAAMVNTKQSGLGLVAPFLAMLLVTGLVHRGVAKGRWLGLAVLAGVPAILLYVAWRAFVLSSFAVGELKPLPFAAWNFALLPQIAAGMAREVWEKPVFFASAIAVLAGTAIEARRAAARRSLAGFPMNAAVFLGLTAGMIVLYNGFLVFAYIALFPADMARDAHSYFRYMSQLSLGIVAALVLWLRPAVASWLRRRQAGFRRAGSAALIGLSLVLPLAFLPYLRFDRESPQPQVWAMAKFASGFLGPRDKFAVLAPEDSDDIAGSMVRGVILFTPPRLRPLEIRTEKQADAATLARLAEAGFRRALVTCTPAGLAPAIPAHAAVMLGFGDGAWRPLGRWYYPAGFAAGHWAGLLPRSAFCGDVRP